MIGATAPATTDAPSQPQNAPQEQLPAQPSQQTAVASAEPPVSGLSPDAQKVTAPAAANDDWRAKYASGDVKKIEALSRYKSEIDWANSWFEQRAALAKRAEPVKLGDNATPEQVAEYRKGLGVPEVPSDAKPEAFLEAYKIKVPDGYEASDAEMGLLGDYAKLAYEQGSDPRSVKAATDFFFQQQAASQQALNQINVDRQKEWQSQLRSELGKDYDASVAAAEAYFEKLVDGDQQLKAVLSRAQLPGGGFIGDHPVFVKLVADLALQNGYSDRIESNVMESGGQSLRDQQAAIEKLMSTDTGKYNDPATQARLSKILELRLKRGEINEFGVETKQRRSA